MYIGTASNLKSKIENSLHVLCELKSQYPNNITIKTYDDLAPLAIILIDDKIIKVEDRPVGRDANTRPSHLTYKTRDSDFFTQYHDEYVRVLKKASDYPPA